VGQALDVVVSGTSSGIGRAVAEAFLARGHRVVGFDREPPVIAHPAYTHVVQDIRDKVTAEVPDPHIVCSCAGTLEEEEAIEVNLTATIAFTERFCKSPKLTSVLIIGSASARNGAEFPRYVASKAGIVGWTKNLALRLARRGVTVNSISPGGVITPANSHILMSEELTRAVYAETLLGKWAEAQEIADLAYFLTVTNRSITGEDILIDNGEMLKSNFIW